jgi:hypothetical protein
MLLHLPVDGYSMHSIREDLETIARRIADAGPAAMDQLVLACMRMMAKDDSARGLPESSPEAWEEEKRGLLYEATGRQWNLVFAQVAAPLLGVSVGEAMTHAAVKRAQHLARV